MIVFLPAGSRLKDFKNCSEVLFVQEVLRLQILVYSLCTVDTIHFLMLGRRYMAEKLPIRRKTLSNQSINQAINVGYVHFTPRKQSSAEMRNI